jgi:hypothetical protein
MIRRTRFMSCAHSAALTLIVLADFASAQTGYGVNGSGQLFSFDVNGIAPAPVTNIGAPLSFVPEGIDFRPGTSLLYAIDVGPNTSQLYWISITNGISVAVGPGFTSTGVVNGVSYDLTTSSNFGFDFNPKTLQGDNSMRIRLVNTSNQNLRLNSSTGEIAGVDLALHIGANSPFVDAVAYINNKAEMGGTTTLYDMDSRNDALYIQNPPNNGDLTEVGDFGLTIDAQTRMHFDVFTDPADVDTSIAGDFGYAVYKRPDAPPAPGPTGSYLLYNVNLATGETLQGRLVGDATTPANFDGGFAVLPVPEPSTAALFVSSIMGLISMRRKES